LTAFREALSLGATHLETDVRVTRDDIPVLFHDPRVWVSGQVLDIARLSLHELKASCEVLEIPTLAEALDAFPTARFNIDIKDERAIESVVATISSAQAWERVLLASFHEKTRRRIVATHPDVITSASRRIVMLAALFARLRLAGTFRRVLRDVVALQIPEFIGPLPLVTRRLLEACHSIGVEVHVWTVNEKRDIERLLARGVDGIISDRCDRVVSVARRLPE
jgi:glycerophosphoryl diester phosphodiesterase